MRKNALKKIRFKIGSFYATCIESALYKNWFNPLVTVYVNFRSFPIKQAIKLPVFVYGWPRIFSLYGCMECVGICKMGMVKINQTVDGAPSHTGVSSEINNWGKILFHGSCVIYTANKISTSTKGVLELGADVKIMHHCNITAYKFVSIGDRCWITHRCQIFDSNFHFIADFKKGTVRRYSKPIVIGKSCWVCNTTTIAAGAWISDCTIVASHSLVNKDMREVPPESVIGGVPAQCLRSGMRRVNNFLFEKEIWKYFSEHPESDFFPLPKNFDHDKCDSNEK